MDVPLSQWLKFHELIILYGIRRIILQLPMNKANTLVPMLTTSHSILFKNGHLIFFHLKYVFSGKRIVGIECSLFAATRHCLTFLLLYISHIGQRCKGEKLCICSRVCYSALHACIISQKAIKILQQPLCSLPSLCDTFTCVYIAHMKFKWCTRSSFVRLYKKNFRIPLMIKFQKYISDLH